MSVCKQCGHPEHTAYCNVVCRCVGRLHGVPGEHVPIPHEPYPDTMRLHRKIASLVEALNLIHARACHELAEPRGTEQTALTDICTTAEQYLGDHSEPRV